VIYSGQQKIDDTKDAMRSHKSRKNRQSNG